MFSLNIFCLLLTPDTSFEYGISSTLDLTPLTLFNTILLLTLYNPTKFDDKIIFLLEGHNSPGMGDHFKGLGSSNGATN